MPHLALSSPRRPMRVHRAIVQIAAGPVFHIGQQGAAELVSATSNMPLDETKLHDWLRKLYALSMGAAIHIKAANMRQGGAS